MRKSIHFRKFLILFLSIIMVLNLTSCTPQKKPESSSKSKQEEKEPPTELDKLRESIEKIEKSLQKLYDDTKKPLLVLQEEYEKKMKEQSGSDKGKDSDQGQSQDSGKGQEQSSQQGEQQKKLSPEEIKMMLEQEMIKKFEDIKKDVIELHSTWNSYETMAVADLASQASINDFENTLNNLTKAVDSKDIYQSMLETVQLYKYIPDFYMVYKTKTPPDLDRFRFAVKKIMLLSDKKEFTAINEVLKYLEEVWLATKPKLKKDNMENLNKFEFALSDLKNSIEAQDNMIIEAKAEVLLKIADEIEKKSEKESK